MSDTNDEHRFTTLFRKYGAIIVFTGLVFLLCYISGAFRLLTFRPIGEHTWAQTDRAAVAYNYYANHASFFLPQTFRLNDNPSGIEAGEFPLLPWVASVFYRLFGFNESWFRLLTFILSICGFFIAFFIGKKLIVSPFLALASALSWIGSGYLLYYTTNFLPDTVSLTFLLAAFGILVHPYPDYPVRNLGYFSFFASLSLLLKASSFFLYVPVIFVFLFFIGKNASEPRPLKRFLFFAVVPIGLVISWLMYAWFLQHKYHSSVFLLGIRPPESLAHYIAQLGIFFDGFSNYYGPFIWILLFAGVCLLLFSLGKKIAIFNSIWIMCILSWLIFFWIFCKQADHHSYYHVPFFFIFFLFFLAVFLSLDRIQLSIQFQIGIVCTVSGIFLMNIMDVKNTFDKVAFHTELVHPDWYSIGPELNKMGIGSEDKIFTCEDPSMNISLYLMKHKGWNCMNDYWVSYIKKGLADCDFAVLTDSVLLTNPELTPFFGALRGEFGKLKVFKLQKLN